MKTKIIGGAVAAVVAAVAYFVVPALQVSATNAAGMGWNDARPDLRAQYMSALSSVGLPADKVNPIVDCVTDKMIEFLNSTDCSYLYNESTTSESEHLANQEACFKKVGFETKEEEFSTVCMKQVAPELMAEEGAAEAPTAEEAPAAEAPAAAPAE